MNQAADLALLLWDFQETTVPGQTPSKKNQDPNTLIYRQHMKASHPGAVGTAHPKSMSSRHQNTSLVDVNVSFGRKIWPPTNVLQGLKWAEAHAADNELAGEMRKREWTILTCMMEGYHRMSNLRSKSGAYRSEQSSWKPALLGGRNGWWPPGAAASHGHGSGTNFCSAILNLDQVGCICQPYVSLRSLTCSCRSLIAAYRP